MADLPETEALIIDNSMPVDEQEACRLENMRRARAWRIYNALNVGNVQQEGPRKLREYRNIDLDFSSDEPFVDLTPGHQPADNDNEPAYHPFTDPNLGNDFDTVSQISTEYEDDRRPCPRYDEIRQYLLENRAQGKLCLDTMDFAISRDTFLHYINVYGGISVTPREWEDFLRTCYERREVLLG